MNRPEFFIQSEFGYQLTSDVFTSYVHAFRAMLAYSKKYPNDRVMVGCCVPCDVYQHGKKMEI